MIKRGHNYFSILVDLRICTVCRHKGKEKTTCANMQLISACRHSFFFHFGWLLGWPVVLVFLGLRIFLGCKTVSAKTGTVQGKPKVCLTTDCTACLIACEGHDLGLTCPLGDTGIPEVTRNPVCVRIPNLLGEMGQTSLGLMVEPQNTCLRYLVQIREAKPAHLVCDQ